LIGRRTASDGEIRNSHNAGARAGCVDGNEWKTERRPDTYPGPPFVFSPAPFPLAQAADAHRARDEHYLGKLALRAR
jgi:hypothetical protein